MNDDAMLLNWIWFAIGTVTVPVVAYMHRTGRAGQGNVREALVLAAALAFFLSIWSSMPMIVEPLWALLSSSLPQRDTDIQYLTAAAIMLALAAVWLAILIAVPIYIADVQAGARVLRNRGDAREPHAIRFLLQRTLTWPPTAPMLILAGPTIWMGLTAFGWLFVKFHRWVGWSPATLGFGPSGEGRYSLWLIGFMNLAPLVFGWWLVALARRRVALFRRRDSMPADESEGSRRKIRREAFAKARVWGIVGLFAAGGASAALDINGDVRVGVSGALAGCVVGLAYLRAVGLIR